MQAIILAGGKGERLKPLTHYSAKQLLPLYGQMSAVDFLVDDLISAGVNPIILVVNQQYESQFLEWKKQYPISEFLTIIPKEKIVRKKMGVIKSIQAAIRQFKIDEDILIMGGDIFSNLDFEYFLDEFKHGNNSMIAVWDCHDLELAKRFGQAQVNGNLKLVDFAEKADPPKSTLTSMFVYAIKKKDLVYVAKAARSPNVNQGGFLIHYLIEKTTLKVFVHEGYFVDVGTHECYENAKKIAKANRKPFHQFKNLVHY